MYCSLLLDPDVNHIDLDNELCSAGRPLNQSAIFVFNVGHSTQTVQLHFFIPTILIDITDFYHFRLL